MIILALIVVGIVVSCLGAVVWQQQNTINRLEAAAVTSTERQYATDESLQDITGVLLVMLTGDEDELYEDDGLPSTLED